jgi:hypothetical protein
MFRRTRKRSMLVAVFAAVGLAACDNPVGPGEHMEPAAAEVYLRGTDERLAYIHGDHWHGRIELEVGEEVAIDVRFLDALGNVIPLGGEYTVRAEVAPGHPTGHISIHNHSDHVDIEGEAAGETRILIHFWHGSHADWTPPALRVVVHERAPEPVAAEVYRRGTQERLAYIHGDHWHGRITLQQGAEIEVDVRFLAEDGNVIPLGGDYTVRGVIAAGQPTNVARVESHGDHLDIEALAAGETRIAIHFWHGDHAEWSTPGLRVIVE